MHIRKLAPAVSGHWLFLLAGGMWTAVGIMLLWRAFGWLTTMGHLWGAALGLLGIALGIVVYRFGFIHTARKNIGRLSGLPDPVCIFAFNSWQGYVIIAVMITLGITLRNSSLPRPYLAVLYTTMGGALFLASLHFYQRFWQVRFLEQPCPQQDAENESP